MKQVCFILIMAILLAAVSTRGAELGVSPTNVEYVIWQGQAALSNQVEVWNTNGTDAMTFTNTVSYTNCETWPNWLTVTPTNGTSSGDHQPIWVKVDPAGLLPRTNAYEGYIHVTAAPGTTNSPQDVRVTVLVQGVALGMAPTNFAKELTTGQVIVGDVFQVANTGDAPHGTIA